MRRGPMTETVHQSDLELLACGLSGTFPAGEDAPLALALLRLLAEGRPVTEAALAWAASRHSGEVAVQLARWPNLERDERDRVVGFSGLTLRRTAHHFRVASQRLHTWCAWDTLFLPALLRQSAEVRSRCPVTGAAVELAVSPHGVDSATPEDVRVSFPPPAAIDTADITASFCCQVLFLAGPGAATAWLDQHHGARTLELETAHHLGLRAVAPLLGDASVQPERS